MRARYVRGAVGLLLGVFLFWTAGCATMRRVTRSESAAIWRSRRLRPSPFTIRTQSRQKKPSRTSAVAKCVPTRKVMK